MSKVKTTSSESNVFSRSLPHYESFVKLSGREDADLRYFAEVAGKSGTSYVSRINAISKRFESLNLNDEHKREYLFDVLHSLEEGLDRSIKRNIGSQKVSKYGALNRASFQLSEAYSRLTSVKNDVSEVISPRSQSMQVKPLEFPAHSIKPANISTQRRSGIRNFVKAGFGALALLVLTSCNRGELSGRQSNPEDKENQKLFCISYLTKENASLVQQVKSLNLSNEVLRAEKIAIVNENDNYKLRNQIYSNQASALIKENKAYSLKAEENNIFRKEAEILASAATTLEAKVKNKEVEYLHPITVDTGIVSSMDLNMPLVTNNAPATTTNIYLTKSAHKGKLFGDIDKYRIHALREGSRLPSESLVHTYTSTSNTVNSVFAAATLSYGNTKFESVRADDFSFAKPAKSFGGKFVDLLKRVTGPILDRKAYSGLNLVTGVITYPSRLVTGTVNTGLEGVNMIGVGIPNNLTTPIIQTEKDLLETGKHLAQTGLNSTRFLITPLPEKAERIARKTIDWSFNVPTEFASNVLEREGFTNGEDMKESVREKGNTGVVAESLASFWLLGEVMDNSINHSKPKGGGTRTDGPGVGNGGGGRVSGPGVN